MVTFADISKSRKATPEDAFEVFDSLPPASVEDLVGWKLKGYEVITGHPLEGLLSANGWFGKEFYDANNGQPLLIYNSDKDDGEDVYACDPLALFESLNQGKPIRGNTSLKAEASRCRLKTIVFRGATTVSMFYDQVPINDTFKKVDENTFFGYMDHKDAPLPYFFVLEKHSKLS
ncbi:hypothetical protein G9P44_002071 [Scheffersomyces stipitis]|nr:hypothetical protein G9P44_002071 [Scheffersomyces stipitis]